MRKITKREYNLGGKTVHREKSDGSYWELKEYDELHRWYEATNVETGEEGVFTPSDLIGDYVS